MVGSSEGAFAAISALGLVRARAVPGNSAGNGIVDVETPPGSILAPYAQDASFIYPAVGFTDLGAGTAAQQTYDAEDPFLAGHWRPTDDGDGRSGRPWPACPSVITGQRTARVAGRGVRHLGVLPGPPQGRHEPGGPGDVLGGTGGVGGPGGGNRPLTLPLPDLSESQQATACWDSDNSGRQDVAQRAIAASAVGTGPNTSP